MDINELSQPLTSKVLNENLAKKFGYKVNLENFSSAQLEDARNKLRTKLSQFEVNESYGNISKNHNYQKARALLDVINQTIFEREMKPEEKAKEKHLKKKYDPSDMKKSMQKQYGKKKGKDVYFATIRKRAMDESVPESWIDSAINRIELGESTNAELKAELKLRYDLTEDRASWLLCEGEELKAEIIIATKDMVDRITGWLEDVAAMKAEQFLELVDSIKAEFGNNTAQQYQDIIRSSLETLYSTLENSRQEINQGLMIVSGGETEIIGSPAPGGAPGDEMGVPGGAPGGEMGALGSELAPPPGGTAASDRAKRESIDYSRRLSLLLNSKKK